MNETKQKSSAISRFAMTGKRGIVVLTVIIVAAFSLGALFFGGEQPATDGVNGHDQSAESAARQTVWTCAMHPQIRLPSSGKCPLCFMDLIEIENSFDDDIGPRQLRLSPAAKQLAQIETRPAVRTLAEAEIRMFGKIAYDETTLSYITAWVPGRLDRLYVNYTGITVHKGEHLVYIYSPKLLATQQELLEAASIIEKLRKTSSRILKSTALATLDAAREKLRLFGLTADQISNIEETGEISDHLTIYAPSGGVVVHMDAKEGMYVKTGTRIYTIADLSRLWVMFEAYESDLPWLRYGQQVTFTSTSHPGETFAAVISFIDPVVDSKTRTIRVRAIVENEGMRLKPDMFVMGVVKSRLDGSGRVVDSYLAGKWIAPMHPEIVKDSPGLCDICGMDLVSAESLGYTASPTTDDPGPLLIPASAPLITGKRAVVYVQLPDTTGPLFEGREVLLGPRAGDFYVVKEGIEEGELIVVNGAFKIDAELQIRAKPSMMSPSVGDNKDEGDSPASTPTRQTNAPAENTKALLALDKVYSRYFDVQMALANDNQTDAVESAASIKTEVAGVDMSLFSRSGHTDWMEISGQLTEHANRLSKSTDIADARLAFFDLSQSVIGLHERFGHSGSENFYLTYCPMAMDNKGAHWLQTQDTVWNSFYGEMMLRCGEIKKPLAGDSESGDN